MVSARQDGNGVGAAVLHNLRVTGFRGRIVPIYPSVTVLQGLTAYPHLADVPGDIDLAIVVVPAESVLNIVREAVAKRVRAVVVIGAGFSESGAEGRAREQALFDLVRNAGVRMIGPNRIGILNSDPSVRLNATFSPAFPPAGRVAFSTQSGALGLAILDYAKRVNLGISMFASIGNKADVSSNDLLQYWADDPQTGVILLYLESFGNPRTFGARHRRSLPCSPSYRAARAHRNGGQGGEGTRGQGKLSTRLA